MGNRFAVAPNIYENTSIEAKLIVKSTLWLLHQKNVDGTWGSKELVDNFICTNHTIMALLAVGFDCSSQLVVPALNFLSNQDEDKQLSFYWRSAPFLNLPEYRDIVIRDIEYLWKFKKRIGVHKDYPVPFFLLKLLKYIEPYPTLSFSKSDVIQWILEEWDDIECWYARTSITSMSLCLMYDLDFDRKDFVIHRALEFIKSKFHLIEGNRGKLSDNLVDDCFTLFNFCECNIFSQLDGETKEILEAVANNIIKNIDERGVLTSPPPFGGKIEPEIYPTAVAVRALMSYCFQTKRYIYNEIASEFINEKYSNNGAYPIINDDIKFLSTKIKYEYENKMIAFIMIPFEKNEIYSKITESIREVLAKFNIIGLRSDDKQYSDDLFINALAYINASTFGIAVFASSEYFNPNVSLEVGYMMGLNKSVCLLKDASVKHLQADLMGKLYKTFTIEETNVSVSNELISWLADKGFIYRISM